MKHRLGKQVKTMSTQPPNVRTTLKLFSESLELAVTDQGRGRAYLILHGGAGPASVLGLAAALSKDARAIVPVHPGFNGQPRPDWFARIDDLVLAYLALIEKLGLAEVVVVGNSVGGWIAAELALRKSPRVAAIALLDAAGIETGSPELKVVDPTKLAPDERLAMSFHDPKRFAVVPSGPEAAAVMAANQKTLRVYAGELMQDPTLRTRLGQISIPALVAWGASDRIVPQDYGRVFAASIPGARFELIQSAGHFPQIERLDETVRLIQELAR
jgi:pimeloyl-ACP methyl ester carboxylesterase